MEIMLREAKKSNDIPRIHYYVSTVGLNEATIRKYIQGQEKYDIMQDKLSVKVYESHFTGGGDFIQKIQTRHQSPLVPKILSKIPSMSEVQASRVSLSVGKVETSRYNGIINQGRQIKTLK